MLGNLQTKNNYSFNHLSEAIEVVDLEINKSIQTGKTKVNAASGLIITRKNSDDSIDLLMGRLFKKKDVAGVHNSYGLFAGSVELSDATAFKDVPAVCAAAAREVNEESLGAITEDRVIDLLQEPSTRLIKNEGWKKYFSAASFQVKISKEEGDKIVSQFQIERSKIQEHEITDLAWVSLKGIVEAQTIKNAEYELAREELEAEKGSAFTPEELRAVQSLGQLYNKNVKISDDISVAHYVARTIFLNRDQLGG